MSAVLLLSLLFPAAAHSQMFSVRDDLRGFSLPSYRVYLGMEMADFRYVGREDDINANRYSFSDPLLRLEVESRNLHLYAGTGGKITGMEGASFSQFGLKVRHQVTVLFNETLHLRIPLQIASDMTTVNNTEVTEFSQFRQGVMTFKSGGNLQFHNMGRFRIQLQGMPGAGVAFSSGGTFGGSVYAMEVGGRLFYDRLQGRFGLSAGYSYTKRTYDISLSRYDYSLIRHRFSLGVTF